RAAARPGASAAAARPPWKRPAITGSTSAPSTKRPCSCHAWAACTVRNAVNRSSTSWRRTTSCTTSVPEVRTASAVAAARVASRTSSGTRSSSAGTSTSSTGPAHGVPACGGSSWSAAVSRVRASRVRTPTVSNDGARPTRPSRATASCVVRNPYNPQYDAGTRTDPPVSVPNATSARWAATALAGPLVDPPGMRPGAAGLGGVP
ncbi:hypothetical protein N869_07240, partial [Cellulomonas bogoriensis 69B4 = DSM 16987]